MLIRPSLVGVTLFALSCAAAHAEPTPAVAEVVRARAIELVDENGQVRAQLNVESSGEAVFRLRGERGSIRVKIGASEAGSGILLNNDTTEPGVHMLASGSGTSVQLKNSDGTERTLTPTP